MAGEWSPIRLGEACAKIGSGATPRGGSDVYLERGPYALIRSQNVYNDGFHHDGLAYIDEQQAAELANVEVLPNDVLLNITGDSVARACQVDVGVLPARVNQHVAIIRPDHDRLDPRFLRYFLVSPDMQSKLLSWAGSGGTRNALTKSMIESFEVPIPEDIAEQRAIAHILGTLDDKIELNRRMSETLEAIARALFKSWFVDFDPIRAKVEGRDPGLPKPLADLLPARLVDSELGEIPEGWDLAAAGTVFDVAIGKTPPRKESHWFSTDAHDVPWMSIKDLGQTRAFISKVSEYLTPAAVERFRVRRIPDGTVVLSFKLTMGRVAITDGEMLSNEAIAHFVPRGKTFLSPAFLYCYLCQFDYGSLGSTSSIATAVNSDSVRTIPVLVPSKGVHDAFAEAQRPSFLRLRELQRESRTLAALRDALLPKLISGEIRVRDAERAVEAAT
jgi:type I restriction enzyme S subunit